MLRFNHYRCPGCARNTYTRNEEGVVTPFFLHCPNCGQVAESGFYSAEAEIRSAQTHPHSRFKATHEFYRDGNGELRIRQVTLS